MFHNRIKSPKHNSHDKHLGKNNLDTVTRLRRQQESQGNAQLTYPAFTTMVGAKPKRRCRKKPHIPPNAQSQQQQQSTIQSQAAAIITYPLALLGSLSKPQIIGLCMLMLIGGAYAVETANTVNASSRGNDKKPPKTERTPKAKSILKQQSYKAVCTDKAKETYNKPNITLGMQQGKMVPKACVIKDKTLCQDQTTVLNRFSPDFSGLMKQRDDARIKYQGWLEGNRDALLKIQREQNPKQNIIFNNIMTTVSELKKGHFNAINARQANAGNCGEHTYVALSALLNKKLQFGLDMKIQFVELMASQSTNNIIDHAYLLLDSNIEDIAISNDAEKVKEAINKITKGKICDPWNHGYYANLKTDNSGFYKSDAGWDHLKLTTYSLNFSDFNQLSEKAQWHICKELTQMGLDVEPRAACRLFRKDIQAKKKAAEQPQQSAGLTL